MARNLKHHRLPLRAWSQPITHPSITQRPLRLVPGSMSTWTEILNDLNRDNARERPTDALQWGADWFQNKLKAEVSLVRFTSDSLCMHCIC